MHHRSQLGAMNDDNDDVVQACKSLLSFEYFAYFAAAILNANHHQHQ